MFFWNRMDSDGFFFSWEVIIDYQTFDGVWLVVSLLIPWNLGTENLCGWRPLTISDWFKLLLDTANKNTGLPSEQRRRMPWVYSFLCKSINILNTHSNNLVISDMYIYIWYIYIYIYIYTLSQIIPYIRTY